MNVGDTLTLSGRTQHGRNRVREQGAKWTVIDLKTVENNYGAFPMGTDIALLASVKDPKECWRWICQANDKNFQIDEVKTA